MQKRRRHNKSDKCNEFKSKNYKSLKILDAEEKAMTKSTHDARFAKNKAREANELAATQISHIKQVNNKSTMITTKRKWVPKETPKK